ncbi:hypothetical protein EPYR_00134 [Erwinia pyrifoliae DSM 12163]|nr:hypothetical protein CPI84_18445 [Erwinia pyrifoliae]MCA8875397.1 hypothetical protein [Erwinia pyrifoliae]CAX53888.1 conserved uncharacterized protein [Erwinia pyrifoliae Ep1/96]CAY72426.1 hypothetical protein EPYR_00134 [Erwinia pyrifoliae DSM 12163]
MIGVSAAIFTSHDGFCQLAAVVKAHIDKVCARMAPSVKKNVQQRLFLLTVKRLLFMAPHSLCLIILIFSPP